MAVFNMPVLPHYILGTQFSALFIAFCICYVAPPPSHLFSSCSILSLESRFPGSPPYLHQPSMISLLKTVAHIVPCKVALGSYVFYLLPWFQYVSLVLPADSYD